MFFKYDFSISNISAFATYNIIRICYSYISIYLIIFKITLLLFFCALLHTRRYIILHNAPLNALSFVTTKIVTNECHFSLAICQIEPIIHNNVYTLMCMPLPVVMYINDSNWRRIFSNNTVNLQYYSRPTPHIRLLQ